MKKKVFMVNTHNIKQENDVPLAVIQEIRHQKECFLRLLGYKWPSSLMFSFIKNIFEQNMTIFSANDTSIFNSC